jgi:hydrogenase expression/formation protein HypC
MCLAVPGKVLEIDTTGPLKMGKVSFGGIFKQVCLEWLPEVQVNEYVIVHVGCAISKLDEKEALETIDLLKQMGDLSDEFESGGEK